MDLLSLLVRALAGACFVALLMMVYLRFSEDGGERDDLVQFLEESYGGLPYDGGLNLHEEHDEEKRTEGTTKRFAG